MRSIMLLVLALGLASAFPSRWYSYATYTAANCTGTPAVTLYNAIDFCTPTATISTKYTTNTAGAVVTTSYTTPDCSGTGTSSGVTYSNNQCINFGAFASTLYVVPNTRSLYGLSTYSVANCAGTPSLVFFGPIGVCQAGVGTGTMFTVGKKLTYCTYASTTCSGTATACLDLDNDQCISGGSGSTKYEFNSSAAVVPALTLTMALVAFVSMLNKF